MSEFYGCGDHGCLFIKPKGQGTNGGCRCLSSLPSGLRYMINKQMRNNEGREREAFEAGGERKDYYFGDYVSGSECVEVAKYSNYEDWKNNENTVS